MSSRRGGSKSKSSAAANAAQKAKNLPAHSAPPSHPIENMREHRAFLARSLSRNDADLAAIVDLNRTLHKVKQNIIDACGEELLLDLGEGLLELTPCGRDLMVALPKSESLEKWKKRKADVEAKIPIFDDHRRLCVDFLLRIKLRRRLLNRFVRRLNRLAHAMDGNDVSPPALPSYGDLRLHLDPSEVKDYESHRKLQEQARDRIEAYRREHPDSLLPLLEVKKEEEEGEKAKKEEGEKSKEDEGNSKKEEEEDKKETGSEDKEDSEEEKTGTEREKSKTATEEDDEDSEDDSESEAKKQEKQEDKASENDKMEVDEEAKDKKTKMEDKKDEAPASAEKQTTNKQDFSAPQPDEKVETNEDVEMKDATKTEDEDETKDDDSSSSDDMFATSDKESEKEGDEKEKDACSPESTKATISSEEVGTEKVTKDEKDAKEPQKEAAADNKAASESTTKSKPEEGMNTPTKQEIAVDTKKEAAADALMTMFSSPSSAPTTPKEESAVPSAKSTEEAITKSEETPKEQEKETANEEMKGEEKADTKTTKEASSKPIEESAAVSVTGTAFADTKDAQEKTSDETKMDFDVAAKTDRMEVEKTVGDDSEPDKPEEEKAAEGPSKAEGGQRDESKSAEEKAKPEAADNETKEEDKDKEAASTAPQGPDERPSTAVKDETQSVADVKMEGTQEESKVPETQTQLAPKPDQPQSTPVKKEPEKAKASTPKKEPLIEMPPLREMNQLEKDCEILKDFVDAYEREIDPMTGEISYRINEVENRKEDFELLQSGPGIGATGRNLSMKEKEVEFHRWQAAVLAKIPEAPTFEELGMKNCVFKLEERRKRLRLEKENEQQGNKKRKLSDASSPMKKSKEDKPRNIGAVERKSPKKDAEAEKQEETVTKKVKPLSLVPLPSFHDSDLTRIRKIHNDLMFSSMFTASKKRVDDLTDEYNKAFHTSNRLLERKNTAESQLNQVMMAFRNQMQQIVQEYERKKSALKLRWLEEKKQYDANRMKKYLPSSWRNKPVGTQITQKVCNHYPENSNAHVVSNCLADVIDGVIIKLQSNAQDEPFEPFEGPQRPDPNILVVDRSTGETFAQRQQQQTVQMQKELQTLTVKLAAAEEERKKAWKKLQKAKMEFEAPEFQTAARMQRGGNSRTHHTQGSSYMPNRSNSMRTAQGYAPTGQVNVSDFKYSSARVRDRVANDGSVAPVNKPKKTADGYYQRPSGRGRKGMTWDAVNGRWVPIG